MKEVIKRLTEGCEGRCAIQYLGSTTTCMDWTPTYDKDGEQVNDDPNIRQSSYHCATCGKSWLEQE